MDEWMYLETDATFVNIRHVTKVVMTGANSGQIHFTDGRHINLHSKDAANVRQHMMDLFIGKAGIRGSRNVA